MLLCSFVGKGDLKMLIDLIPKMANLFNDFMSEYGKKVREISDNTPEKSIKLHTVMINVYAIKAVRLAVQHLVGDEKQEIDWNNWLKKHGVEKEG